MSDEPEELRLAVLPATGADLVLPAAAVVEILRISHLTAAPEDSPPWLAGRLEWRGTTVPLARLGADGGQADDSAEHSRRHAHAAICRAPSAHRELPFLAIESRALPRLARVTRDTLARDTAERPAPPPFSLAALLVAERPVWLLDLDELERALLA